MVQVICLRQGDESAPLYCLPTASGSVGAYLEAAVALAPDHAVYGVELSERTQAGALKLFTSLQEMAEVIAPVLLSHCWNGPICLLGYSFAGHLAIALAQQLERRGRRVGLLVIIDTMPSWSSFTRMFRLRHVVRHVGPWLLKVAAAFARDKRSRWDIDAVVRKLRRQHVFEGDTWFRNLTEERKGFLVRNLSLSYSYAFEGRYGGHILLLRPTGVAYGSPFRTGQLHDFGWQRATGAEVRVGFIPGDHASCLQGANAVCLADELRLALKACGLVLAGAPKDGNGIL